MPLQPPALDRRRTEAGVICVEARTADQLAMHHWIRHAVFVEEQAIFAESDVDEHDASDDVVRVLAFQGDRAVGSVRLYPLPQETGLWKGDRLAVLADCRTCGAGGPLVRFAVAHAGAHGGRRMIAHVQTANVRFFERLGWSAYRDVEMYLGLAHQPMEIGLTTL
ncbi:MAG TPA: MSMEG_0567/Sll0786 family nitrogen starvation N-acetyltransferase [Actinomycetales bacterium]|nr:MSMEG_0567/Sll0786 family nitrogen starvation N-acetyltransferase [Actinomycetales bacterium]